VFSTGNINGVDPFPIEDRFKYAKDDTYPNVVKRHIGSSHSMHSHDDDGVIPSLGDLKVTGLAKNKKSLIFTERGILMYTCKYENIYGKFQYYIRQNYKNEGITSLPAFYELPLQRKRETLKGFYKKMKVVVEDVPWEQDEQCQDILDTYFEQK
jgi:hypothetical protein